MRSRLLTPPLCCSITPHPSAARLPPPPCSSSWAAKAAVAAVTTLFVALTSANTDLHPCGLLPEAKTPQRWGQGAVPQPDTTTPSPQPPLGARRHGHSPRSWRCGGAEGKTEEAAGRSALRQPRRRDKRGSAGAAARCGSSERSEPRQRPRCGPAAMEAAAAEQRLSGAGAWGGRGAATGGCGLWGLKLSFCPRPFFPPLPPVRCHKTPAQLQQRTRAENDAAGADCLHHFPFHAVSR